MPNLLTPKADIFLTPAEQNNGCLFIDMGAGTTSYILRTKGKDDIKGMVNMGGYLISNDLTYKGLSFNHAEKLKKKLEQIKTFKEVPISVDEKIQKINDICKNFTFL